MLYLGAACCFLRLLMRALYMFCAVCLGLYLGSGVPVVADVKEGGYTPSVSIGGNRDEFFSFKGRLLFYNWGRKDTVPEFMSDHRTIGTLHSSLRHTGIVRKEGIGIGADCDFFGDLSFEYLSGGGVSYGANFQVLIPEVTASVGRGKAILNRGSKVFIITPYGKFSAGYQEGVESVFGEVGSRFGSMFDDFSRGRDATLMKYKLPILTGDFYKNGEGQWLLHNAVLLYPGLYSESVFRANNYFDYYGTGAYNKHFVNSLPFRFSYQSPRFFGMRVAMSYSPSGYGKDMFVGWTPNDNVVAVGSRVRSDVHADKMQHITKLSDIVDALMGRERGRTVGTPFTYAPSYAGILSAAWSYGNVYQLGGKTLKAAVTVTGEYAKSGAPRKYFGTGPERGFKDLVAMGVSGSLGLSGFSIGATYGNLGRSGYPMGPIGSSVGPLYKMFDVRSVWKPSYYFVLGGGYARGPLYVEASYFSSVKGGYLALGRTNDVGLRMSYELYRGVSMRCVLFTQLQRISVRYNFASKFIEESGRYGGVAVAPVRYDFDVLAAGVKLVF